jgi:signal transduction histidine kinase
MSIELVEIKRQFRKKFVLVQALLALFLVFVSYTTNYYIKKQNAGQITRIVSRMVKKGEHREAIYTLGSAKLENFSSVGYFDMKGRRIFSLPSSLNNFDMAEGYLLSKTISEVIYFGESEESQKVGVLKFNFHTGNAIVFGLILWVISLLLTFPVIRNHFNLVIRKLQLEGEKKRAKDLVELAGMVKHDLRSPLQSILMAVQTGESIDEQSREMILSGVSRIEKITQDLNAVKIKEEQSEAQENGKEIESCSLFSTVQEIIQEKTHTYRKIKGLSIRGHFKDSSITRFIHFNDSDFKRVLSNLIDNAVECFDPLDEHKQVEVNVTLEENADSILIEIIDNGPGIPKIVLSKIGEKGNTYGKENGSGLGIYSSRNKVLENGGEFKVKSNSKGTNISMRFRAVDSPDWFAEDLNFSNNMNYVILDDDESVIERFKNDEGALGAKSKSITSFNNIDDFTSWYEGKDDLQEPVFFIDYDLKNSTKDGLDVISSIDSSYKKYLFTNNFDDFFLQRICSKQGVKIIPKTILGWGNSLS